MSTTGAVLSRDDILDAAGRIDPLPASVSRLLELSSDPDAGLADVADVIRYDPVLSVDVLRRANSALSSARYQITEVNDAVARLGSSEVLIMGMKRAMQGRMSAAIPGYGLSANELWLHALAAAVGAEMIAHQSPIRIPSIASTAALLHDVGKLVIAESLAPSVIEFMVATATETDRPLHDVEREILGVDHAEIGGVVLRDWGFPLSAQIAVTRHHDASDESDTLTFAVAAANAIADALPDPNQPTAPSGDAQEPNRTIDADMCRMLLFCGIQTRRLPAFMALVEKRFSEVMSTYQG